MTMAHMDKGGHQHHFPGHDLRATERQVTVLINAGLACRGVDGLCRIRNLSPNGLKVETLVPLQVDDEVSIQLRSGRRFAGTVRWVEGHQAGLACTALDTNDILNDRVATDVAARDGAFPVFDRDGWVSMRVNHQKLRFPVSRISLFDVTLSNGPQLPLGSVQEIEVEGLPAGLAKLVHRNDGSLRFMFTQPVNFRALEAWLQGLDGVRQTSIPALPAN